MGLKKALFGLSLFLFGCGQPAEKPAKELILLTTTTTRDSGILDHLVSAFEKQSGYQVKSIVAGSGDVLKQGAKGEGDVVFSHSPTAEKEWMEQGNGDSRRLAMFNDFIIVGPTSDPAQTKGQTAVEALKKIADAKSSFVSRGDKSGTHVCELSVWKSAGIFPQGQPWYRETGQGQGLTMDVASQQQAYALTDRGTFLVHQKKVALVLLVENDPALLNIYHVMTVDAKKFPKVNAAGAKALADFLVSAEGQERIGEFGKEKYGRSLFVPAAGKKEEDLLKP